MMKIILLILLSTCSLLNAEYPRYKPRGPPQRRRSPPQQQFLKKWHQGGPLIHKMPQGHSQGIPHGLFQNKPQAIPQFSLRGPPVRQKPVNMNHNNHIPMLLATPSYKIPNKVPLGIPQLMQRPVTLPVRNIWKNPVNNVQFLPEKVFKTYSPPPSPPPVEKQKPFRSAPSLPAQEYDYHIQTNQIPQSQISPIKQIGEKGPIHTIPAPNLSPKDKPTTVHEVRTEQLSYQHKIVPDFQYAPQEVRGELNFGQNIPQSTYVTIQKSHEYQVTEPPEHNQKLYRAQQEHQKQIQLQIQKQIEQMQKQNAQHEPESQQIVFASDSQQNPTGDIILSNNLNPKDIYQLVSANYPQPQQSQQLEHVQLFQPEATFIEQFPQESTLSQESSEKISFQPEYQSFNYDEQAHQKSLSKKDMSSLVSATYNLGSEDTASRNSEDSSAESELVQSYFENRSDVNENKLEPDAKPSKTELEEKLVGTAYFSSLPNKEAAERLAQLQNAGKINSNLMKLSPEQKEHKEPMTILIPDDDDNSEEYTAKLDLKEDYDDEDENRTSEENTEFGHRIQPKKRAE